MDDKWRQRQDGPKMKPGRDWKIWLAAAILGLAAPASAQLLGGHGGIVPNLPAPIQNLPGTVDNTLDRTTNTLDRTLDQTLDTATHDLVGRPLSSPLIARDALGQRIVKGEVIAVSPSTDALAAAGRLGLRIVRRDTLSGLGLSEIVFSTPDGMSADAALAALRRADPNGSYDYDHLYDPSGEPVRIAAADDGDAPDADDIRIGMIDGGIDRRHPAFDDARVVATNVVDQGTSPPSVHGTAVASLLVGEDGGFHGYLPGATLFAADAYGGKPTGGAADDIVRALDWLAKNDIAVANVSLAGPPNALLAAAVKAFVARGHVLVAAIGNGGPAAPPAYPANYPGVIAVTSVDGSRRLEVDAGHGHVTFAALGVGVRAAARHGYQDYTGTSFAAPAVAARFALLMPEPDTASAARALRQLADSATPLGSAMGYGYLDGPNASLAGR